MKKSNNKKQQQRQNRRSNKKSELLTLASTSQAVQRQLAEMKEQAKNRLQQLTEQVQPLLLYHQNTEPNNNNDDDNELDGTVVDTHWISNWKTILQMDPNNPQPNGEGSLRDTLDMAKEELRTLSQQILNDQINVPILYQLFDDTKDLRPPTAKYCQHQTDIPVVALDDHDDDQPSSIVSFSNTEEDGDFAKQSDLLAVSKELEELLQRRVSFLEENNDDSSSLQFLLDESLEQMKLQASQLADKFEEQKQIKRTEEYELQQDKQLKILEHRLNQKKKAVVVKAKKEESDICIQPDDIVQLVEEASLATAPTLEKVLTNTLRYQMEDFLEDYNQLETYRIVSSSDNSQKMNHIIDPVREKSSSILNDDNLRFLVDTSLLPKVSEWLDTFLDTIAGYNDSVDDVIDLLAGDERNGESVGKRLEYFLIQSMEHIQLPDQVKRQIIQAGVLTTL